jgi:hypothetical protein
MSLLGMSESKGVAAEDTPQQVTINTKTERVIAILLFIKVCRGGPQWPPIVGIIY